MKLIKLIPGENDKYHFGEGDLTDSPIIFHSHSLYSAIINNLIKLHGDEDFVEYEKKEGDKEKKVLKDDLKNIKLSLLLPAIYKLEENDDKPKDFIYFLPKPATKLGFDKETQDKAEDDTKAIKEIKKIQEAGADILHLDVMDGHFVPNLTFGLPIIRQIKKITQIPLDVHLMVENPQNYLEELVKLQVKYVFPFLLKVLLHKDSFFLNKDRLLYHKVVELTYLLLLTVFSFQ